jgi:hypothetical protein
MLPTRGAPDARPNCYVQASGRRRAGAVYILSGAQPGDRALINRSCGDCCFGSETEVSLNTIGHQFAGSKADIAGL